MTPSFIASAFLLVVILFILIYGAMIAEYPVEFVLISTGVAASFFAILQGESWKKVIDTMSEKIKSALILLLVLYSVGMVIGTWMMSGTIPYLVYFGIEFINPQYLYIMAFFATAIVSICIGSSFSSAGTIGVAIMGIAASMDVNMAIAAGAVVSGAYFGDKLSPLSDTVIMSSLISEVNVYDYIKHLLYTSIPSMVIAAIVFLIAGFNIDTSGFHAENIENITLTLEELFKMGIILLVPPLIIFTGSLMKKPVLVVLYLSSAAAMLISLF